MDVQLYNPPITITHFSRKRTQPAQMRRRGLIAKSLWEGLWLRVHAYLSLNASVLVTSFPPLFDWDLYHQGSFSGCLVVKLWDLILSDYLCEKEHLANTRLLQRMRLPVVLITYCMVPRTRLEKILRFEGVRICTSWERKEMYCSKDLLECTLWYLWMCCEGGCHI